MVLSVRRACFGLAVVLSLGLCVDVYAEETRVIKAPEKTSPYFTLLEGLKLIKAGKFDDFVSQWCSKQELCINELSIASLKKYNLPTMQRLAPDCLKTQDTELQVTKVDGDPTKDKQLKIFLVCKATGTPKPFSLINEKGWKFEKL